MKKIVSLVAVASATLLPVGVAEAQQVRGVTKTEILIGMHTDLSGPAAPYGVSTSNAARIRFDEVNAAGGIHGRKIKLIVEDTQYQVPRAVQAANKLLNRDRIFLMAGALGTPMNNAVFKEQFEANVPNLFPITAARSMAEPFHKLKFQTFSSYYDQVRGGLKHFVEKQGKKSVCSMYQDTDFGQEIFEGTRDQLAAMNMKVVETTTHKPTDTDFTAAVTKLRAANCDIITMGTIIRDSIIPYGTARKAGWAGVEFLGTSAAYDYPVAAAAGGATEGFYTMSGTIAAYRDTAGPEAGAFLDKYKARYNADINMGAIYGYVLSDLIILALDRAGANLNVESFLKGLESINGYRDIFGGPVIGFSNTKHQGTSAAFLSQSKGGRWVKIAENLTY